MSNFHRRCGTVQCSCKRTSSELMQVNESLVLYTQELLNFIYDFIIGR